MDDGKRLNSSKNSRENDTTSIINPTYEINDRKIEIYDLTKNIHMFSIRKYKNNLRVILRKYRCDRNKVDCGLEDNINMLLYKYDIK